MSPPFELSRDPREAARQRAERVKAEADVPTVADWLGLMWTDGSVECPACGVDRLRVTDGEARADGWWCRVCAAKGDVIDYVRAARDLDFAEAVAAIEDGLGLSEARCDRTKDLFAPP